MPHCAQRRAVDSRMGMKAVKHATSFVKVCWDWRDLKQTPAIKEKGCLPYRFLGKKIVVTFQT